MITISGLTIQSARILVRTVSITWLWIRATPVTKPSATPACTDAKSAHTETKIVQDAWVMTMII